MAGLDDALVSYLTDKYADGEEEPNDATMKEMDDLPDSASVGGSDASMSSSSESEEEEEGGSDSSDADTVIDNKRSKTEEERLERKKRREEKRARKRAREEKREKKRLKKEKKERKRKKKDKKDDKAKRRKTSRDDRERSSSRRRDDRERSSSRRRDDRERSSSRRRSPSPTASVRSFRSVHADFRYGKDSRRSSSRARSRSPDRHSTRSERPYRSSRSKRSRSRSRTPEKAGRVAKKEYGEAGARAIPPPTDLYTMREHANSDSDKSDEDGPDEYKGSGLSKEDKMKLLEIAKKNALNVHGGLNKNESISMRAGGLTIEQLTAKCQRVADGKEDPITEDIPDDMLNHPFAVVEKAPEQLTFRPIFLKPKQVDPLALPADASMAQLTKSFPVSAGIQHREVINDYDMDKEGVGEWTEGGDDDDDEEKEENMDVAQNGENGESQMSMQDIQSAIADRVNAMRKLQENPDDSEAQTQMDNAQELLSKWSGGGPEDNSVMPMSWAELNTGNPAWAKKDQFHVARKVEGLGKKLLEKMGWKEGMGLGKNAQGNAEPLVLDFKINREGLSSNVDGGDSGPSFMGRKGFAGGIVKDLSGKHPVSALMEVCSKRRWGQPEFTLLTDPGAGNNRSFLYKVRVYDTEYQPATPSLNKKTAKAASATVALQALGLVPRA